MIVLYNESQKLATKKYKEANYKRIPFDVRTSFYLEVKEFADLNNYSLNGFIREAVVEKMERMKREKNEN